MSALQAPQLDLSQLRYFLAAAQHGSISAGAAALGVPAATLSENLARLEKRLGLSLALRGQRGLVLTAAGRHLARRGPALLEAAAALTEELGDLSACAGPVSLALPTAPNALISLPLAETVRMEMPGIRLRIAEAMSGDIITWIAGESADLGLVYEQPDPNAFDCRFAFAEELFLVAAPDFLPEGTTGTTDLEIAPERLDGLPLVTASPKHNTRRIIERVFRSLGLRLNIVYEIESASQILEMVNRASAYSLVARATVLPHLRRGETRLIRIAGGHFTRRCYVIRKRDRAVTAASLAIEAKLLEILREMNARFALDLTF